MKKRRWKPWPAFLTQNSKRNDAVFVKTVRTHPKYSILNVRGLIVIYLILCVLTVLFSKTFLAETLREGKLPGPLNLIVFFTIPSVLLVFLALSLLSFLRDIIVRRMGSRFQIRLIGYFFITVLFAAMPVTIITIQSIYELVRFWRSIDMNIIFDSTHAMVLENYAFNLKELERLALETDFDSPMALPRREAEIRLRSINEKLAAVQDFYLQPDGSWKPGAFAGDPAGELPAPPGLQGGLVFRELPRDQDLIRYIVYPRRELLRVINYSLGRGFDRITETIENEKAHFDIIDSLRINLSSILIFYYGVFFLPTLLMTTIIALSFTKRVAQPIVELTDATRRVAEGDFSIHILARRGDELGVLIRSFNAMVQNLEQSRLALIKAEKISLWQTMAQQLAHEIKNPLTPIKLSAERVLRRWRNNPEGLPEILENSMLAIIQEVEGLSNLLNEFKTYSRPMAPSLAWTTLRELAEETVAPYRTSYPGLEFSLNYIKPDISIKIDRRHIAQALTNLIINAIDAMDGRGTIEIRADLVKKRETCYCRISIRDTGKGIAPTDRPQIFMPYFTTKESGTGLGLPIVERIVNDHGGAIWFNSAEGLGTTFFIDLPIDIPQSIIGKVQDDQHTHH
jgi:nitrogen fixation/metabolism regulation signal transduction histidine kinase